MHSASPRYHEINLFNFGYSISQQSVIFQSSKWSEHKMILRSISICAVVLFSFTNPSPLKISKLTLLSNIDSFVEDLGTAVDSQTRNNVLGTEIIPNLSKSINSFLNENDGLTLTQLESGAGKLVEDVLINSENYCKDQENSVDMNKYNVSLLESVTDDLVSKNSNKESCFYLNARLSGTDVPGGVVKKSVQSTVEK